MPSMDRADRSTTHKLRVASEPKRANRLVRLFAELHSQRLLGGPTNADWHLEPTVVLLVAAASLAVLNFLSTAPVLSWLLSLTDEAGIAPEWTSAFWVGCRVLCYLLIPLITLWSMGRNPLDCGFRMRGTARHVPLYLGLAILMAPILIAVSFAPTFQRYYPFHDYAGESLRGLVWWECLYAVQFVALEFFYRGFLLFSLQRYIGAYAIFVMVIPYCMVHFGKPFIETLAAIPAGIILGALALRTRSIWPGAALHIAVGWSMDLLSLGHRGALARILD
jgi:membrane protease YdiL (CAAX protease family)